MASITRTHNMSISTIIRPLGSRFISRMGVLVFGFMAIFCRVHGDDAATTGAASVSAASHAEEAVRAQTGQVNDDLLAVIDDMKLNGMSDTQISVLLESSGKLTALNQQDMQKIIDLLKAAGKMPSGSDQQTALLDAYQQQKGVSTQLKALALALANQMAAQDMIKRIEDLAVRQAANQRQTDLLKGVLKSYGRVDPDKKPLVNRVQAEQRYIADDMDQLTDALKQAAPSPNDAEEAAEITDLQKLASDADYRLKGLSRSTSLPDAAASQGALEDKLLQTLSTWKNKEDAETRLQQARAQVDALLKDQKALFNDTNQAQGSDNTLAQRQAAIADRAELAQDIRSLNPAAGEKMDQAKTGMHENTDTLASDAPVTDSLPKQTSIITSLASAAQLLAADAKMLEAKKKESAVDLVKDMQHLKARIDQAKQEIEAKPEQTKTDQTKTAKAKTDEAQGTDQAKKNEALAAKLTQLQKDASAIAPEAAHHLNAASAKLHQSHSDAAKELDAASQSIKQQLHALAPPSNDSKKLAKAGHGLREALKKATDANNSLKDAAHPDAHRVASDLSTVQDELDHADANTGKLSDDAHQAIQKAKAEFKQAADALAQNNRTDAQKHTEAGLNILKDAHQHLAQARKSDRAKRIAAAEKEKNENRPPEAQADVKADEHTKVGNLILKGSRNLAPTGGPVVGTLSPKDRDALMQHEAEKTPPEYAPLVQQYMKNLSDSSAH